LYFVNIKKEEILCNLLFSDFRALGIKISRRWIHGCGGCDGGGWNSFSHRAN
jgi:hypothetical protein